MSRPRHRQLTSTLTRALQTKANQVQASPTATPFDPTRPPSLLAEDDPVDPNVPASLLTDDDSPGPPLHLAGGADEHPDDPRWEAPDSPPRARRQLLLRVAAVLFVAVLVGAALAAGPLGIDDRNDTSTSQTTTTSAPDDDQGLVVPDGALMPTWAPDGMDLWSVTWIETTDPGGETYQLFGDPDAGRSILVRFQPNSGPGGSVGGLAGGPVTVRGQAGLVQLADTTSTLIWDENGGSISASYRGMTIDEAVAALEALEWRSATYRDGFAEPDDGSLPLRGETEPSRSGATPTIQYFYSEGVPTAATGIPRPSDDIPAGTAADPRSLMIRTTMATHPGQMSPAYLEAWFYGTRQEGGSSASFEDRFGMLHLAWPDGRTAYVDAGATPVVPADVERVGDGITTGSRSDLEDLLAEADGNATALPQLAGAETSVGTLAAHGQDPFYRLCRTDGTGGEVDCGVDASTLIWNGRGGSAVSSFVVDGDWYLGVASDSAEPPVVAPDRSPTGQAPFPRESVRDGAWRFLLVEVPDDFNHVTLVVDGVTGGVDRPR